MKLKWKTFMLGICSVGVLSGCSFQIESTEPNGTPTKIEITKEEKQKYEAFMGDILGQISTLTLSLINSSADFLKNPNNLDAFTNTVDKKLIETNALISKAIDKQKNMKVSKEFEPTHKKMNTSLTNMQNGVNDVKEGTTNGNPIQVIDGMTQIEKSQSEMAELQKQIGF